MPFPEQIQNFIEIAINGEEIWSTHIFFCDSISTIWL